MADPSSASRALRTWILNPYAPNLTTFDESAYGVHGDLGPSMVVAIASPKPLDGVSAQYPDFIGGVLRAAGATGLYSPPNVGNHSENFGLVITCGHLPNSRTLCVWTGTKYATGTGTSHTPFLGALLWLSVTPTADLEQVSENTLYSIAG